MRVEALQRSGWLEINDDSSFPSLKDTHVLQLGNHAVLLRK